MKVIASLRRRGAVAVKWWFDLLPTRDLRYKFHRGALNLVRKMSAGEHSPKLVADLVLPSSLDSVDTAESQAASAAESLGMADEDVFRFGYAVREAMVNAVVHGNRYSANKSVIFRIQADAGSIEVMIRDQGGGFNADSVADPLADENLLSQSGRGLTLIRAFVDELKVEPAEGGGTVAVLRKYVKAGTGSPPKVSE